MATCSSISRRRSALQASLDRAVAAGVPILVGTTGLDDFAGRRIATAAKDVAVLRAANTSLGVALLADLVERAAKVLGPEWDIEILEMHHRLKADAPSGTALALGDAAARGRETKTKAERGRDGTNLKREEGAIGFASLRGGTVAGDHDVIFAGPEERLILSHRAENRMIFARGALAAAKFLVGKPAGRIFDARRDRGGVSPFVYLILVFVLAIVVLYFRRRRLFTDLRDELAAAWNDAKAEMDERKGGSREAKGEPISNEEANELIDWYRGQTRPALLLRPDTGSDASEAPARLGGKIWFADNEEWPQGPDGERLEFIAHLDFSRLPRLAGFPKTGVARFFVGRDDIWGADFNTPDRSNIRVLWHDGPQTGGRLEEPLPWGERRKLPIRVRFHARQWRAASARADRRSA